MIEDAKGVISDLLADLSFIEVTRVVDEPATDVGYDFAVDVTIKNRNWSLLIATKSFGEPRLVREAVAFLSTRARKNPRSCFVFAAPYLSDETQGLCRQAGISFFDLSGNCRIEFDTVLIEKLGRPNRLVERRPLKSLFSAKSSRIVRKMLANPRKAWRVQELARETQTSIGLVSRLKQTMLNMDFLPVDESLRFPDPESVLRTWTKAYSYKDNDLAEYFAPLDTVPENERALVKYCSKHKIDCGLALFSSANRVEPFVRGITKGFAFVAEEPAVIASALDWKKVPTVANFMLLRSKDAGYFYDLQTVDELPLVGNIQTFLDLASYKGRGEEAAEHLLERRIRPTW